MILLAHWRLLQQRPPRGRLRAWRQRSRFSLGCDKRLPSVDARRPDPAGQQAARAALTLAFLRRSNSELFQMLPTTSRLVLGASVIRPSYEVIMPLPGETPRPAGWLMYTDKENWGATLSAHQGGGAHSCYNIQRNGLPRGGRGGGGGGSPRDIDRGSDLGEKRSLDGVRAGDGGENGPMPPASMKLRGELSKSPRRLLSPLRNPVSPSITLAA